MKGAAKGASVSEQEAKTEELSALTEDPELSLLFKSCSEENKLCVTTPCVLRAVEAAAFIAVKMLMQGKRILLVADSDDTAETLRKNFPQNIASLCAFLSAGSSGLRAVVPEISQSQLLKKEKRLKILAQKLSSYRRKLYDVILRENAPGADECGTRLSVADMAERVKNSSVIPDRQLLCHCPLSSEEIADLYAGNALLSAEEEAELSHDLPHPAEFPSFDSLFVSGNTLTDARQRKYNISSEHKEADLKSTDSGNKVLFNFGQVQYEFTVPEDQLLFQAYRRLSALATAEYLPYIYDFLSSCTDSDRKKQSLLFADKTEELALLSESLSSVYNIKLTEKSCPLSFRRSGFFGGIKTEPVTPQKAASFLPLFASYKKDLAAGFIDPDKGAFILYDSYVKDRADVKRAELLLKREAALYECFNLSRAFHCSELFAESYFTEPFLQTLLSAGTDRKERSELKGLCGLSAVHFAGIIRYICNDFLQDTEYLYEALSSCTPTDRNKGNQLKVIFASLPELKNKEQICRFFALLKDIVLPLVGFAESVQELKWAEDSSHALQTSLMQKLNEKDRNHSFICRRLFDAVVCGDRKEYESCLQTLCRLTLKKDSALRRGRYLQSLSLFAPEWSRQIKNRVGIHGQSVPPAKLHEELQYRSLITDIVRHSIFSEEYYRLIQKIREKEQNYAGSAEEFAFESVIRACIVSNAGNDREALASKICSLQNFIALSLSKEQARTIFLNCTDDVPLWCMSHAKALMLVKNSGASFDSVISVNCICSKDLYNSGRTRLSFVTGDLSEDKAFNKYTHSSLKNFRAEDMLIGNLQEYSKDDSPLERDTAELLHSLGFRVLRHRIFCGVPVSILLYGSDRFAVIECDGTGFEQSRIQAAEALKRQFILEHVCCVPVYRIRSTDFYTDRNAAEQGLLKFTEDSRISPHDVFAECLNDRFAAGNKDNNVTTVQEDFSLLSSGSEAETEHATEDRQEETNALLANSGEDGESAGVKNKSSYCNMLLYAAPAKQSTEEASGVPEQQYSADSTDNAKSESFSSVSVPVSVRSNDGQHEESCILQNTGEKDGRYKEIISTNTAGKKKSRYHNMLLFAAPSDNDNDMF